MSRKLTTYHRPPILWLIERAPSEEILIDLVAHATRTPASLRTRKRWADAAQERFAWLQAHPAIYEKVSVQEASLDEFTQDDRPRRTYDEIVLQVLQHRLTSLSAMERLRIMAAMLPVARATSTFGRMLRRLVRKTEGGEHTLHTGKFVELPGGNVQVPPPVIGVPTQLP